MMKGKESQKSAKVVPKLDLVTYNVLLMNIHTANATNANASTTQTPAKYTEIFIDSNDNTQDHGQLQLRQSYPQPRSREVSITMLYIVITFSCALVLNKK